MTHNLFQGDWTVAKIEEVLVRHPRRPLLPPLGSSEWLNAAKNPLVANIIKPIRAKAGREIDEPLPELTDDLYADFRKTGIRLTFEKPYFERRRRLTRAAVSVLLCDQDDPLRQRLIDSTIAKLESIFDEVSWALPAHVNWHNDDASGKDPYQIDLFAAETANLMAEMLDLLGGIIPAELQSRIRERLQDAFFENYLKGAFYWKEATHNWNAVCHQGIIGAALSQLDDPHLLAKIIADGVKYLRNFLSGFGPDGGCSEGPGYWSYGFGWFTVLNEQLETRTGGELSLFEGDTHIRAIARYGPSMTLSGGKMVNFSDNGATGGPRPALLSYLAARLNEPDYLLLAHETYRDLIDRGENVEAQRSDLFNLVRMILHCPQKLDDTGKYVPKDCFLPDLAVLVARGMDQKGRLWEFAAKAGHNEEHHNHNDCGNYILNIDGERIIAEIGAPEYVKDFFSPKRYEFLAARSLGHSLPVINGCEQAAGKVFASKVIEHSFDAHGVRFVVDVTDCYPPEAGCKKFTRTFRLDKAAGSLAVEDEFELSRVGTLEGALITPHPVSIHDDHAVIKAGVLEIVVMAKDGARFDRVDTHTYQDHDGHEARIQRIVLAPAAPAQKPRIGIEIKVR